MQVHPHLDAWLNGRVGYGRLDAPAWFLGIEEASGKGELERRLGVGACRPEDTLVEDLQDAHGRIPDGPRWFTERPPLQRTWTALIHAHLVATGHDAPTRDDRRAAQRDSWGRAHVAEPERRVLLAELWPLPSPKATGAAWADVNRGFGRADLANRTAYEARWGPVRVALYRDLIARHRPRWVVAYGRAVHPHVRDIAHTAAWSPLEVDGRPWGETARVGDTTFVLAPHPASSQGASLRGWAAVGRVVRGATPLGC